MHTQTHFAPAASKLVSKRTRFDDAWFDDVAARHPAVQHMCCSPTVACMKPVVSHIKNIVLNEEIRISICVELVGHCLRDEDRAECARESS